MMNTSTSTPRICSTHELSSILGAIATLQPCTLGVERVLTDSRSLVYPRGTAFYALRTASGDGHRYLGELYQRGVRIYIVDLELEPLGELYPEAVLIRVPDTLVALQRLAQYYRARLDSLGLRSTIGITGSNGKTIVKEMLYTLLEPYYARAFRSPGSYNSQIGVPLSVLQMPLGTDLALLEAGISLPGEMALLAPMIRPDYVVLTSIGSAHSENFASTDALIREKLQLALHPQLRHLFYCLDDQRIASIVEELGLAPLATGYSLEGHPSACIHASYSHEGLGTHITLVHRGLQHHLYTSLSDTAGVQNVLLALSVVATLRPDLLPLMARHVGELRPMEMRLELKESLTGTMIINDSYSCDLESMSIALDLVRRRALLDGEHTHMAAILSDIEGSALPPAELYATLGSMLVEYGIGRVYGIGQHIGALEQTTGLAVELFPSVEAFLASSAVEQVLTTPYVLVKGARRFAFERIVRTLSLREHHTQLEVDLAALRTNLAHYRSLLPPEHPIICMIKADAYGLGAYEVARTLEESRVGSLAVAVADEGKALRKRGIETPIIVMNPQHDSLETLVRHRLDLEVYSLALLRAVAHYAKMHDESPTVHLKVETGMHRLGITEADLPEVARLYVEAEGRFRLFIFSHLAVADAPEHDDFTHLQAQRLEHFAHELQRLVHELSGGRLGRHPFPLHLLNTAGIERFGLHYAYSAARLGIGLYGSSPTASAEVKPVARLTTTILQTKDLAPGDAVGYGLTDVAHQPMRIAIVPIGYADGLSRRLSNGRWSMLVRGQLCPIVGRICMDTCMIDLSRAPEAREGDRVVVFGEGSATLEAMATAAETIPYEILTSISERVERLYYQS